MGKHIAKSSSLTARVAKCVVQFKDYITQTKVNKPQELNVSSTANKTETEQKKRKPQGRVQDRYYTIQEYKAVSNEQKNKLKDLRAHRDITLRGESSTRVMSRNNCQHLNNKSQSYSQTMGLMLELLRIQPNLAPQHLQKPQPTLKTVIAAIILPSLTSKPDTRLKGTEKLMDHLEEESLSQIKIQIKTQRDTPHQRNQNFQSWLSHLQ